MERRKRLSATQNQKLIEHFVAGTPARSAAVLCAVSRRITTERYHLFRTIIATHLKHDEPVLDHAVEADESYFGGRRKGTRGRGAAGKVAVFGLYQRNGYVYAVSVYNTKSSTLLPILHEKVLLHSIVYTDQYKSYDTIDTSRFRHVRINHSKEFVHETNHINGIENFWSHVTICCADYLCPFGMLATANAVGRFNAMLSRN